MLIHPTHDRLLAAGPIGGLTGIASALEEQRSPFFRMGWSDEQDLALAITPAEPIAIANTENAPGRGYVMRSDRRIEANKTIFPQIANPK